MLTKDDETNNYVMKTKNGDKIVVSKPEELQNVVNQSLMRLEDTSSRSTNVCFSFILYCNFKNATKILNSYFYAPGSSYAVREKVSRAVSTQQHEATRITSTRMCKHCILFFINSSST